jgi:hypothetical protein
MPDPEPKQGAQPMTFTDALKIYKKLNRIMSDIKQLDLFKKFISLKSYLPLSKLKSLMAAARNKRQPNNDLKRS